MKLNILFTVAATGFSLAQADVITVGVATTANCAPFMCNAGGTSVGETIEYQQVYSSTAFSGLVTISSETFYWSSVYGGSDTLLGGQYVISLSTTAAPVDGLSSILSNNLGADNTTVLTLNVLPDGESFGNSFTFINTIPYTYNPSVGNLLVDIAVFNQDIQQPDAQSYMDADSSGILTSRAYAFLGSDFGGTDSIGLVTTFNAVPEPSVFWPMAGLIAFGGLLSRKRIRATNRAR